MWYGSSYSAFPYQTLPPNVVMKILVGSRGSTITRWPHLKSNRECAST